MIQFTEKSHTDIKCPATGKIPAVAKPVNILIFVWCGREQEMSEPLTIKETHTEKNVQISVTYESPQDEIHFCYA